MTEKYFSELSRRLQLDGIPSSTGENQRLEIFLRGRPALFVSPVGDVTLLSSDGNDEKANDLYHHVAATAGEVYNYVDAVQSAPFLRATSLSEPFHLLADFGGAVLAGQELGNGRGYQFATWIWDFNREGLTYGHYFQGDFQGAKQDFAVRSGLISKAQLFTPAQLIELYRATDYLLEEGAEPNDKQLKSIQEARSKIEYIIPNLQSQLESDHGQEPQQMNL